MEKTEFINLEYNTIKLKVLSKDRLPIVNSFLL